MRRGAQIAVIGADLAETLFPGQDALGRSVRIGGRGFEVVGVQSRLGTSGGQSLDRYAWIPLTAYERVFGPPASLQVFAKLFYFQSRGIPTEEAVSMIINGFCKDVFQQLPMEFAVEATKLLGLKLEGSVG